MAFIVFIGDIYREIRIQIQGSRIDQLHLCSILLFNREIRCLYHKNNKKQNQKTIHKQKNKIKQNKINNNKKKLVIIERNASRF